MWPHPQFLAQVYTYLKNGVNGLKDADIIPSGLQVSWTHAWFDKVHLLVQSLKSILGKILAEIYFTLFWSKIEILIRRGNF